MNNQELPIRFDDAGLISAVIVDATVGDVLMVGFMNREALTQTRSTGIVHFWSRSRNTLWKKGETSGHVQRVCQIRVNCELNSVLIEVDQVGATCHDGYASCFYRRLEPDNSLATVRDRQFDPADVYSDVDGTGGLAATTQQWWSGYEHLRDHDLEGQSGTSRRLRSAKDTNVARVADEMRELAGVLNGSHEHGTFDDDIALEAGQMLYWIVCSGVFHRLTWEDVRPDRALDLTAGSPPSDSTLSALLVSQADLIDTNAGTSTPSQLHDLLSLVATCLRAHDLDPLAIVRRDIAELEAKPYSDTSEKSEIAHA